MNVRNGVAVAITLASILLLSRVWCMFFSPIVTSQETKDNFYTYISIENQSSWSYSFDIQKGDTIDGSVDGFGPIYRDERPAIPPGLFFNVKIYDSDNDVVWSKSRVTYTYYNLKVPKTGNYRVEVQNPNKETIEVNVQVTIRGEVIYRPLDSAGQWLSLTSLPIFGLGIWTSGILTRIKKKSDRSNESTNLFHIVFVWETISF